jgi:hypothetical protein
MSAGQEPICQEALTEFRSQICAHHNHALMDASLWFRQTIFLSFGRWYVERIKTVELSLRSQSAGDDQRLVGIILKALSASFRPTKGNREKKSPAKERKIVCRVREIAIATRRRSRHAKLNLFNF